MTLKQQIIHFNHNLLGAYVIHDIIVKYAYVFARYGQWMCECDDKFVAMKENERESGTERKRRRDRQREREREK